MPQARARFVCCSWARSSPWRFTVRGALTFFLAIRHDSNGLCLLALIGVSSASLFIERVVRLVAGGDTGPNFGASGVFSRPVSALEGVAGASNSPSCKSSTSVAASSSSIDGAGFSDWNNRRGLIVDRLSGRVRWADVVESASSSSSSLT
jgi:hypothetical protein